MNLELSLKKKSLYTYCGQKTDSPEGLQKQLNGLYRFCSKCQMIVNELKTMVMIYGKHDEVCSSISNAKTLQKAEEYKY